MLPLTSWHKFRFPNISTLKWHSCKLFLSAKWTVFNSLLFLQAVHGKKDTRVLYLRSNVKPLVVLQIILLYKPTIVQVESVFWTEGTYCWLLNLSEKVIVRTICGPYQWMLGHIFKLVIYQSDNNINLKHC